jgi:Ca-activated chloride channel homolog
MVKKEKISNHGLAKSLLICALVILTINSYSQTDKKYIREGNKEYGKNKFSESEISYRKAIDKNAKSPDAIFNTGDALYKQNKFEDAGKEFTENINMNDDKIKKSAGLYNLGNSLLKANKLPESIEAYKGSLKLKPNNKEAKYNLAYAQDLLVKQKEQEKQQKKNQDKNKEDQKKDQKDKDKDKNQKDKDQQKDKNGNQDKQDQKQQPQTQQDQSISKDDAQRLLNALANDEKNVQEKVKLAKAAKTKVRTVKNW